MVDIAVYYRINPTFMVDKTLTKQKLIHGKTHVLVAIVDPDKDFKWKPYDFRDTIYTNFQGDFISKKNLEALEMASRMAGKRLHTSMSVGDALMNLKTGKACQVANVGWEPIPAYRRKK